jgi:hypothetical protein
VILAEEARGAEHERQHERLHRHDEHPALRPAPQEG